MDMATAQQPKQPLPLWRHHQSVVLPVVFICADGHFVETSQRSSPSIERPQSEPQTFDAEGAWLNEIARAAHERLLGDGSAVDVVHCVLNELSRNSGRWPCKRGSDLFQSSFMMDGDTKRSGAVACFHSDRAHAVDAARHVLDKTEYHLLCGEGARSYIDSVFPDNTDQPDPQSVVPEDTFVFDSTKPLSLYVIAADRNGSIACGSFDEQKTKESASTLNDSVLMGNGMYADSRIGSAIAINLNKNHKTSGFSLAWVTTQLMRDYKGRPEGPIISKLSTVLSNQLRRYIEEPTVVFALHNTLHNLPTMKLSIFSFCPIVEPSVEKRTVKRKCTALSLVSGGQVNASNHFYWSTILTDLKHLSSSSLFDAHPYGMSSQGCPEGPLFTSDESNGPVTILVHGGAGAGATSIEYRAVYMKGVKRAAMIGYRCLVSGGKTAVQAVREAVRSMEDDYVFNAGCGSYLTRSGHVEMDGMIQDGKTGRFGAVGAVKNVRNVIELCSTIMDDCNAEETLGGSLLVSDCAKQYAEERGIETCEESVLICDKAKKAFEKWQHENISNDNAVRCGTVGAVAIDRYGNVASATSTGGLTGKIDGRVGDTPMPGCGTTADNRLGAVSATGIGEHIMATCVSRACLHFIEQGRTAQEAAEMSVEHLASNWLGSPGGGRGGVICISPGLNDQNIDAEKRPRRWGLAFNTEGMCWSCADEAAGKRPVLYSGLVPGELNSEQILSQQAH